MLSAILALVTFMEPGSIRLHPEVQLLRGVAEIQELVSVGVLLPYNRELPSRVLPRVRGRYVAHQLRCSKDENGGSPALAFVVPPPLTCERGDSLLFGRR